MTARKFEIFDTGYALQVIRLRDGANFLLQGDDANKFREEWQDAEPAVHLHQFLSLYGYDDLLEIHA